MCTQRTAGPLSGESTPLNRRPPPPAPQVSIAYSDHWVSNVFDRESFLGTMADTLGFEVLTAAIPIETPAACAGAPCTLFTRPTRDSRQDQVGVCVCGRGGGVRIKLSLPCVTVQPKVDFNAGVVAAGEAMIEVAHSCSPY